MDEFRLDARAYDPAHVNAVIREARRMRNAAMIDMVKSLFDGRATARLFGPSRDTHHDLPTGTASQS